MQLYLNTSHCHKIVLSTKIAKWPGRLLGTAARHSLSRRLFAAAQRDYSAHYCSAAARHGSPCARLVGTSALRRLPCGGRCWAASCSAAADQRLLSATAISDCCCSATLLGDCCAASRLALCCARRRLLCCARRRLMLLGDCSSRRLCPAQRLLLLGECCT